MDDQEIREILDSDISDKDKIKKLDDLCPNFYQEGTEPNNKRRKSDEEIVRGKARAFAGL